MVLTVIVYRSSRGLPGDMTARLWGVDDPPVPAPWYQLSAFMGAAGSASVAVPTIVVALWVVWRNLSAAGVVVVLAAAAGLLLNAALKGILGPSPPQRRFEVFESNYPSGHVVYATVLFGALAWLGHRHRRPEVTVICIALVVGMGPARVAVGAHFPSDVIAGYLLGGGWLALVLSVTDGPVRRATNRAT